MDSECIYTWDFPLERTHCGMLLGNATIGAMVWGGGHILKLSIGRADFWDHRGGLEFDESITYENIKSLLYEKDEQGLRKLFYRPVAQGQPARPSVLPVGRLDVYLAEGWILEKGELLIEKGEARITIVRDGERKTIILGILMHSPCLFAVCRERSARTG
ncbi:unnamed protein product, partial [marine sediment metagenome]